MTLRYLWILAAFSVLPSLVLGEDDLSVTAIEVEHGRQALLKTPNYQAAINVEPRKKIVRLTKDEAAHGSSASPELRAMYYFIGDPKTIYGELQEIREAEGYPFFEPKYDLFGVGWEAFGALGWTTSAATVEENLPDSE